MSILLCIAQIIRAKLKWVQNLYLPTAMIAGFIGLFFGRSFLEFISLEVAAGRRLFLYVLSLFRVKKGLPQLLVREGDLHFRLEHWSRCHGGHVVEDC